MVFGKNSIIGMHRSFILGWGFCVARMRQVYGSNSEFPRHFEVLILFLQGHLLLDSGDILRPCTHVTGLWPGGVLNFEVK